jgi:hypothetical protein
LPEQLVGVVRRDRRGDDLASRTVVGSDLEAAMWAYKMPREPV